MGSLFSLLMIPAQFPETCDTGMESGFKNLSYAELWMSLVQVLSEGLMHFR